ncbi:MAG: hypothetical protein ACREHV_10210 [Rhizomicrobium sp.]
MKRLVWHGHHGSMIAAIQREKSLKKYGGDWKIILIERENPHWSDLFIARDNRPAMTPCSWVAGTTARP